MKKSKFCLGVGMCTNLIEFCQEVESLWLMSSISECFDRHAPVIIILPKLNEFHASVRKNFRYINIELLIFSHSPGLFNECEFLIL